jgi:hypothetical protein
MIARAGQLIAGMVVILLAASSLSSSESRPQEVSQEEPQDASWTVMVYMAADTENALPWEQDINELEAADQADGTNIVVLLDPDGLGDSRLLRIEHDDNYFDPTIVSTDLEDDGAVIPSSDEVNTGSPATLRDFIVYSSSTYPADNLVLVMWGHGAGWRGLCPDGLDLLTLPELRSALLMSSEAIGRAIDLVVLDTCSGATLELAYEIEGLSDLLVASEVLVPSTGLPYMQIIDTIAWDPSQSTRDFAESLVERYIGWSSNVTTYSTSMGVFDLEKVDGVVESLDRLSLLGAGYDRLFHEQVVSAIHESEYSEDSWNLDTERIGAAICAFDLPADLKHSALLLAQAHQSCVVRYQTTNEEGSIDGIDVGKTSGLSLHAPSDAAEDEAYAELRIAMGLWSGFSRTLRESRTNSPSGPGPSLDVHDSQADEDDLADYLILTWPEDPAWDYSSYLVNVFQVMPHGVVWCCEIQTTTNVVMVDQIIGNLLVSASAFIGDEAYAHATLTATLAKVISIEVSCLLGGDPAAGDFEVVANLANGEPLATGCADGFCTIYVVAPHQVDVGGTIRIELVDASNGDILSQRLVVIRGEDTALTLTVHELTAEGGRATMTASIIAMLAILGVATMVYANFVRRR